MPLVRVQVRNEYGLGLPELYREANREDPKAVLDGVAVAGLVGILRQLGDLAEFAAEVFHGVQEQVMATASRSHKLVVRVQHIEAALPPLERTILTQKSHLHFAYTAGSQWHAHIHNEQNHFIYNDLPRFILDSYEECRDPPCLHLLDRFDTEGPGSCLKRYSDATFFRKASASSYEANAAKDPRDKKVRRRKKKRAWQKNGEVARGSSISNYSGRMQFASQNVDEQPSPSHTISTVDVTLKSDIGDQSNSFESRTGSGYIDCVFHPSYSIKPEEQEPYESPSPRANMKRNHTLDSAFVDERSGVTNDDSPPSSSQDQTGPSSSCVTWDEKTEIVEPTDQDYDHVETVETLPTNFSLDSRESEVNFRGIGEMEFEIFNGNTPTAIPDGNQMEENESEPDSYVDALNTIESESETDLDCQTKREVHQHPIFIDDVEDGIHELKAHHSDHHPSTSESHTPVYDFSNKLTSQVKPDSVSSEFYAHDLKFPNPNNASGIGLCGNADSLGGSNIGSVVSNISYSGSEEPNLQAPMSDRDSKKSHELSRHPSVTIWTNGGLLGLEPSKPPDCSILNGVSKDSVTRIKDDTNSPSSQRNILNGDGYAGNHETMTKSSERTLKDSECSKPCHDDKEDRMPLLKKTSCGFPPTNLDTKLGLSGDSHHSNRFNHTNGHVSNETSPATPGTEQPVNQEDGEKTSRMFGLGNRLLVNGFRSKPSVVLYENSVSASSNGVFEKKSKDQSVIYQAFSESPFKEHSGRGLPINSPSSSPPLQHMKISFQPVNGFETSKLSLKFPDRVHSHESCEDMFPSFQLVPEPSTPLQYNGSDSDDDTFCRSSPYISDDCLSHNSESNSEQWESEEETPRNKDHELYDALCRISLSESVSSSHELEVTVQKGGTHVDGGLQSPYAENDAELYQSSRFLDLPSFEKLNLNPLYDPETISEFDRKGLLESHSPKEPTPIPPPLPPLQWRVMKPHLDVEDNQDDVPEAPNHAYDLKLLESTIALQSESSPVKQHQNIEEINAFAPKKQMQQPEGKRLNEQTVAKQATNGKGLDEKEDDFLHQIRAKSFSLRRTSIARSTSMPTPPANFKVTAILEKANAIRQAVGSDNEEDDDTWSDT